MKHVKRVTVGKAQITGIQTCIEAFFTNVTNGVTDLIEEQARDLVKCVLKLDECQD